MSTLDNADVLDWQRNKGNRTRPSAECYAIKKGLSPKQAHGRKVKRDNAISAYTAQYEKMKEFIPSVLCQAIEAELLLAPTMGKGGSYRLEGFLKCGELLRLGHTAEASVYFRNLTGWATLAKIEERPYPYKK